MAALLGSPVINLPRPLLAKPQHPTLTSSSQSKQQIPQTNNNQLHTQSLQSTECVPPLVTRRFGLGAGLAWAAFLAVNGNVAKDRFEASQFEAETEKEVLLPNGIRYYEMEAGEGATPKPGDLVVMDIKGRVVGRNEQEIVNTFGEDNRCVSLVIGSSMPYSSKAMCEGLEFVVKSMRLGAKRRVVVPPTSGFGDKGMDFGSGVRIPGGVTLEFVVQVDAISI